MSDHNTYSIHTLTANAAVKNSFISISLKCHVVHFKSRSLMFSSHHYCLFLATFDVFRQVSLQILCLHECLRTKHQIMLNISISQAVCRHYPIKNMYLPFKDFAFPNPLSSRATSEKTFYYIMYRNRNDGGSSARKLWKAKNNIKL